MGSPESAGVPDAGNENTEVKGWGGFPLRADSPLAPQHQRLEEYLKQSAPSLLDFWRIKPRKCPAGLKLLEQSTDEAGQTVRAILERLQHWLTTEKSRETRQEPDQSELTVDQFIGAIRASFARRVPPEAREEEEAIRCPFALRPLLDELLKQHPPLASRDLESLVYLAAGEEHDGLTGLVSHEPVMGSVEHAAAQAPLSPSLRQKLNAWRWRLQSRQGMGQKNRKLLARIVAVLGIDSTPLVEAGEAWSEAVVEEFKRMSSPDCLAWTALLRHCGSAEASKPSGKWLGKAAGLVNDIGQANFKEHAIRWFELVALPRPAHREPGSQWQPDPDLLINEKNATVLRGLVWCCAGLKEPDISRALSNLAEVCFKKVRWLGPRCPRVGNACLYSLSSTASEDAAAQLSKLDQVVKQPTAKKRIGKSLDRAAEATGQSRADLEEKSVPTFDLGMDGKLVRRFGQHLAELRVLEAREVQIAWFAPDGKPLNSVPAEVKREHAADLKQLQKLGKDVQKMLGAQRIRLERLLMSEREWDLQTWRQRYLEHPLLAPIVRRLLWHFKRGKQSALAAWLNGKLVDVDSRPLDWLAADTRVRLWHPIGFPVETTAAWRRWLEHNEVCQPFKQAHREIYILTDAELTTATYSNRFAAHIIGQHQFAALATQRGWKYSFMGGFDFQSTPTLELPAWNLVAEFWVDPAGELAESGVARYLTTDQVRFLRDDQPLALTEVPAPVFSEVMRDIDLFVGVCSIGNDPAWRDQGEIEGGGDYWRGYSFGELSASANTRREVLERLLPRLKIAGQCTLQGKFLVVRGALRTYKIHLGSGNILMEPNDAYLCIVPERGLSAAGRGEVFLPFEGDHTLSIILSKAFLLAQDTKINDKTILSQIAAR